MDLYTQFEDEDRPVEGLRTQTLEGYEEFEKTDDEILNEKDAYLETDLQGMFSALCC